jgi:hypothetical protein
MPIALTRIWKLADMCFVSVHGARGFVLMGFGKHTTHQKATQSVMGLARNVK